MQPAADNRDAITPLATNGRQSEARAGSVAAAPPKQNHVICEDLLDFATVKAATEPKNGNNNRKHSLESDEVRIMQKVLANEVRARNACSRVGGQAHQFVGCSAFVLQVTLRAEECAEILDETQDIHKAIKCIRLREQLRAHSIRTDCNWIEMLARFNWNIRQASNYLIATRGEDRATEV